MDLGARWLLAEISSQLAGLRNVKDQGHSVHCAEMAMQQHNNTTLPRALNITENLAFMPRLIKLTTSALYRHTYIALRTLS